MMIASRNGFATRRRWKNPYVTDGLQIWLDGIQNAARDVHDVTNSTYWMNLVTNEKLPFSDMYAGPSAPPSVVVGDNYVQTENKFVAPVLNGEIEDFTIECIGAVVADSWDKRIYCGFMGGSVSAVAKIGFGAWYLTWNSSTNYMAVADKVFSNSFAGLSLPTALVVNNGDLIFYRDGQEIHRGSIESSPIGTPSIVIPGSTNTWATIKQRTKVTRVYSRALTASEIAANYAVDKARFGLP